MKVVELDAFVTHAGREAFPMRPVALSMRGAPVPQPAVQMVPAVRVVASAAVGAAAGGAAGWSLARWQQRRQQQQWRQQQQVLASMKSDEESTDEEEEEDEERVDKLTAILQGSSPSGSPLHDAALLNNAEGARKALAAAANPKDAALAKDERGFTALLLAVLCGSEQVAQVLLEAAPEAAMVPCGDDGWLPVHIVAVFK